MPSRARQPLIEQLREHFGPRPFRAAEAIELGVSSSSLHRLRRGGQLESLGHGLMQLPGAGMGMLSNLAVVSTRVPAGSICLNSALSYWDLTDEVPDWVHVAVPRGTHRPTIDWPPTKVHVFRAETFNLDRLQRTTDVDEPFCIYSPERSIVDAIRLSSAVGSDVGFQALRRYLDRRGAAPARLTELARELGGLSRLRPALEALLT